MQVGVSIDQAIELANETPLLFETEIRNLSHAHNMVLANSLES